MNDAKELILQIKEKKQQYKTDSYPMSLGEVINLYKNNELVINPDFQRFLDGVKDKGLV